MAGANQLFWTPPMLAKLTQLHQAGLPGSQVALTLGATRGAVASAIVRYGIKKDSISRPCLNCRMVFCAESKFIRLCNVCKSSSDIMCGA
ncbi:hypothetical protein V1281_004234 [Nitrobacteraceae bacterium AZCC 2161]